MARDDELRDDERPIGPGGSAGSDPFALPDEGGAAAIARHQPAPAGDLAAFPPRDAACRAVRGMLRDHCDRELGPRERARVDDHVHECRDCALALSRMELEVLRLRQAFGARDGQPARVAVPAGFTQDVLARVGRVLDEEAARAEAEELAEGGDEPPPQFTRRVMERVRLEHRRPAWRRHLNAHNLTIAAATVVVVAALVLSRAASGRSGGTTRFEVALARDAWLVDAEGVRGSLGPQQVLAAGERVETGAGGIARLDLFDAEASAAVDRPVGRRLAPARVELDPDSACEALGGERLRLASGTAFVQATRSWSLSIVDGSEVQMSAATALVTVDRVRRYDVGALGRSSTHRVRVEVVEGRARIARGALEPVVVDAGHVARFDGVSPIEVEVAPTLELLARSREAGRAPAVAAQPVDSGTLADGTSAWTGRVIDAATGLGVGGASVRLEFGDEVDWTSTNSDGWFRFTAEAGRVAIVRVMPPEDDRSYASFGPEPIALEARQGAALRIPPIALAPDVPVRGIVRRADGRRLAGARLLPCVVDDVFGIVERLDLAAVADQDGLFELRGLPVELPRHQMLAILVEADGLPRHARLDLGGRRGGDLVASLEIEVPDPRSVSIAGFEPLRPVRVLREIPGLPISAWVEEHRAVADANGSVFLDGVGPGALWSLSPGGEAVRIVGRGDALAVGREQLASSAALARLHSESRPLGGATGPIGQIAEGRRLETAAVIADASRARRISVRDATRSLAPRSRLFLETASGRRSFLGEYDGTASIAFDEPEEEYRIVAIGDDGSLGVLSGAELDGADGIVTTTAPGEIALEAAIAALSAAVNLVAFDALDGPLAGQRFWRIVDPAHGYRVEGLPAANYAVTLPDGSRWTCSVQSEQSAPAVRDPDPAGSGAAPLEPGEKR